MRKPYYYPILKIPYPYGTFEVCIDTLKEGLGGVLMQDEETITYESRKLKDHEMRYATHELQLAIVVHASKMWRHHLLRKNSLKL